MAVEIDSERKAVNIKWDVDKVQSDRVDIYTKNPATGDKSSKLDQLNDGYNVVTYPNDFSGVSNVLVVPAGTEPPEGGEIAPGEGEEGEVGTQSFEAGDQGEINVP
jgi:hypothetical protein